METVGTNINDLPNDVLEYILSFLSTLEVVKTCVLSQQWRYIWKSVPTVRVNNESIEYCRKLLDHVILHRGNAAIHICHLEFIDFYNHELDKVNLWIFHAISVCNVKELRVSVQFEDDFLSVPNQAIISKYLRKLELDSVKLKDNAVDFTNCPFLEELQMVYCVTYGKKITSKSLKCLRMENMVFWKEDNDEDFPIHISVPSVMSFLLIGFEGWTPSFDRMSCLRDACVTFTCDCYDTCEHSGPWDCGNEDCEGCYAIGGYKIGCLLLDNLSGARHLELVNGYRMSVLDNDCIANIFYRDLRWCPLFKNIKTLLLNEWFVDNGFYGLLCILRRSPVLEKITLKLYKKPKQMVENEKSYNTMAQSFEMKHVKKINVKCIKEVKWVRKIVKALTKFGIPQQQIYVKEIPSSSGRCSKSIDACGGRPA